MGCFLTTLSLASLFSEYYTLLIKMNGGTTIMKKTFLKSFFLLILLFSLTHAIDKPVVSTDISIETFQPASDIPLDNDDRG